MNVFNYASWIQNNTGTIGQTSCGVLPQVGDSEVAVSSFSGDLSAGNPQETHSIVLHPGSEELRITINAIDDGTADFDLYVKAGSPPTTSVFDCGITNSRQFDACLFDKPTGGNWHILVSRAAGAGRYQLTASSFDITSIPAFPYTE